MTKSAQTKINFEYAVRNGYAKTFAEYQKSAYAGYVAICKRCDIKPMSFTGWCLSAA